MTQYLTKLALLVALGAGVALAQAYPQSQQPSGTQPTTPQTQQNPPAPDQTQPQVPDKEKGQTQPSTPDKEQTQPSTPDKDKDQTSKMPQSDTAAASSTDVESSIQQALQKEPSLSGSNIQVKVTNKDVALSGTVNSNDEKDTAERIAKSNAGTRKVKNHIKVSAKSPSK